MSDYRHHVSGFFVYRTEAESARTALVERGLPRERLQIMSADSMLPAPSPDSSSNAVLKEVLVDGAISSGQIVLVAETRTVEETAIASDVIKASVGDCEDVSTA